MVKYNKILRIGDTELYGEESSKTRNLLSNITEKIAYFVAIVVGVGFLWLMISLLGWWGFVVLIVLSIAITAFKIGFLWFLR